MPNEKIKPVSFSALEDIGARLAESQQALGVLVYGSFTNPHWDGQGDVDLICVGRNEQVRHSVMNCEGLILDIYSAGRHQLEASIRRDTRTNNNFVLDAFAHGRCVVSEDGSVQSLIGLAQAVWLAGPPEPSVAEFSAIVAAIQKTKVGVRLSERKVQISDEWDEITRIKLSHLFLELVYCYCRVHRLWGSSLWEMLGWSNPQYQDLLAMCRKYLTATSHHQRIQLLLCLADASLQRINHRTDFSIDIQSLRIDNPRD